MSEMIFKPMRVYGVEISEETQRQAIESLRRYSEFEAWDMQSALIVHGAPFTAHLRGADRLLQKARRAGLIRFERGAWRWCEQA